jgi:MFS family permease
MFVGRLVNAPIVERLGTRFSLLVSGVLLILANVLLMVAGSVAPAVAGFVLLGFGVAGVIPTALVIASRTVRGDNGAITGATMAAGYSGFIICPPVIGAIADWTSLSTALLSVGLSGLAVLLLAWGLERPGG